MSDYDFHQLSPHDLETLARDLLQAESGIRIESFKPGKDQGIDLRYSKAKARTIVQCKHYYRTGLSGLLRNLKKERKNLKRLKPLRYILVTTVSLSAANKEEIASVFGGELIEHGDIIGVEDLNNLLGRHPHIERKHFKLWLGSKAVLDRVLHNAEVTASEFTVRQVYKEIRKYVATTSHTQALEMLDKERLVILSGPPGVGKTTLANLVLYEHLEKGYQAVVIHRDVREGLVLLQQGIRQVFYFDDFMGATFLGDRLAGVVGNEDKALLEFIQIVRSTPTARLILTTREHIYSQGLQKSERLRHAQLEDLRVLLKLSTYSLNEKAKILYNHIYFSELPPKYRDGLLDDDFYLNIIKHKKFNPRVIEWLSNYRRVKGFSVKHYLSFVERLLDDPSEIWRHAYEQEICEASRSMLFTLFSLGGESNSPALKLGFDKLHEQRSKTYGYMKRADDYRFAFRELDGAFLTLKGADQVKVLDPSVLDLLNAVVLDDPESIMDIIAGAHFFEQFSRAWEFAKSDGHYAVLDAMANRAEQVEASAEALLFTQRSVNLKRGVVRISDASLERRLLVLTEMADNIGGKQLKALFNIFFDHCIDRWRTTSADIDDLVDVLEAIRRIRFMRQEEIADKASAIRNALIAEVQQFCSAAQLKNVITTLEGNEKMGSFEQEALREGFQVYKNTNFDDELSQIQSQIEYDELRDSLEFFEKQLHVTVADLLGTVDEAEQEFLEREETYADENWDDWRDLQREEKATERGIINMFGSLKVD